MSDVRLDKWLWAARFFKTRALARKAIEGGKVHLAGQRAKPSKMVEIGQIIEIRQGVSEKVVQVLALDTVRKGASNASQLFLETSESIAKREKEAQMRKLVFSSLKTPSVRPNKKQRRQLIGMKQRWEE